MNRISWPLKIVLTCFAFSFLFPRIYNSKKFMMVQLDTDDGYYLAWTEGILQNHSINWCEGNIQNRQLTEGCGPNSRTRPYNKYGPGSALLLLPFNYLGLFLSNLGFDFTGGPFVFWSLIGTFFLFCGGTLFLYGAAHSILRNERDAFWTSGFFLFGNVILYYVFRRPLMAHVGEYFLFFALVYLSVTLWPHRNPNWWVNSLLGFLATLLVLTRMTDFYIPALFAIPVLFGAFRKSRATGVQQGIAYVVGCIFPLGFFFWTNYLQTGSWIYRPEQYDAEFSLAALFVGHPRNWLRILDFFVGLHWGSFWLMPFIAVEAVFLALHWCAVVDFSCRYRWMFVLTIASFMVHLVNMANFPMNGAAYGLRYILTVLYGFHVLFLFILGSVPLSIWSRRNLVVAGIISSLVAWLNLMNYESNQTTLTLTWGTLAQEGTRDPKWKNSRQLVSPYYAMNSLEEVARLKAVKNLGVIPLVAYPMHIAKDWLPLHPALTPLWEYYESPKREVHTLRDLKPLAQYHAVIAILIGLGVALIWVGRVLRSK